jgi:hypothetical protein
LKLKQVVPVELRYETIVLEDGKLHIYRDVYDQDANTEENLRAVLEANDIKLEDLDETQRDEILEALNAMSRHPMKMNETSKANTNSANADSSPSPSSTIGPKKGKVAARKPITRNQKEVVIELAQLKGKGYPAATNLDTGSGKPAAVAIAKATP